ncbi:MAG: porin family protein [Chlorobiaceae bacterium]|nr:porin family protein [Chlorobiaceae bacterium]
MKKSTKTATLAVALFAGIGSTALANGTETVAPPQAPATMAPAPEPYMPPQAARATSVPTSGPYISGAGGVGISGNRDVDTGYVLNAAAGYRFDNARLEAAVGYQRHGLKNNDGHLSYLTFMANAYYDAEEISGFKPYVMGGIGVTDEHFSPIGHNDSNLVWQVGTGIGIKMDERTTFDLGYRYFRPENGDVTFKSHNILAGIRYQF